MKKLLTTSGLIVAALLFLAVNILINATLKSARLDLTDNQLYTLSEGTRNILTGLEEPVTLRFYLSQKLATNLPGLNTYTVRVKELLEEYQRIAGSKLTLELLDPEPFSEEEDRAVGYGLQGVPIDSSNTTFYFGLVGTNSTDDEQVIPFFQPNQAETLEYDVTKLIYRLVHPKQKVVGIMSTLPVQGGRNVPFTERSNFVEPWTIIEQIRQLFEVRTVETDVEVIPEGIDVLMLIHPKNLSEKALYAIDQFVLRGGRAMVFVDTYSEADTPPSDPNNPFASMNAPRNSDLTQLFDTWGLTMTSGKVAGDKTLAQQVQIRKGQKVSVINYPVWMNLNAPIYFNAQDVVTSKLGNIVMASPGVLKKKDGATTEFVSLFQTSEKAMEIETTKLGFMSDPEGLERDFKAEGQFTLAARITGKVKTAFPDGKPKSEESKDKPEADKKDNENKQHLTESKDPINVIVVADTDLLEDKFWVQVQNFIGQRFAIPTAANGTFVTNAIDNLTGSNDLISVRNRGGFTRSFTKVEELQKEAEQQLLDKQKELEARLESTEQKIMELQSQKQGNNNALILSSEQQKEIENFRNEKIKIRKELRTVQHELRKNIERLETQLKFANIGLIPILIGLGGILLGFYRSHRKRGKNS